MALFGLEMGWGLDQPVGLEEMLVGRICQDKVAVTAFRNTIQFSVCEGLTGLCSRTFLSCVFTKASS
jgi:hypothetical protein